MTESRSNRSRMGVWLVAAVGVFLLLASIYPLVVPVNEDDFVDTTGVEWSDFSAAEPEVANYLEREARLLGAIAVGFALLSLAVALGPLRQGNVATWKAMWVFPLGVALVAAVFLAAGGGFLGAFYGALAALAALGMWMSRPTPA